MSKAVRNFLILAAVLVIVGAIIAGAGFAFGGLRSITLTKDGPIVIGTDSKDMVTVDESYKKITTLDVDMDLGEFKLVEGDSFSLKGRYTSGLQRYEISENNGVLTIRAKQISRIGIGYMGVGGYHDQLTFTYPKGTKFDKVTIILALGSLEVRTLEVDALDISLDAGALSGSKITADRFTASLNLGSCDISQLSVSGYTDLNLDAGGLTLSNATVGKLRVNTHLGSVDFSGKLTGDASFNLDLGSLTMKLDNAESDVSYFVSSDIGSITINGKSRGNSVNSTNNTATCTLDISLSMGSANLRFK